MPEIAYRDDADIGLLARFHFATHTRDFDKARAFYRQLGYTDGVSGFPLTNTHQMARALGMYDLCQYELVKGEVIMLPGSPGSGAIDLLQFKTPFNGEAPYEPPNHLGMAYAALLTTNLDADVAHLKSLKVDFLSEPYGEIGARFVFSAIRKGSCTSFSKRRHLSRQAPSRKHEPMVWTVLSISKALTSPLPGVTDIRCDWFNGLIHTMPNPLTHCLSTASV
jgi:catechol 2,3-dioxygenase-like lactoylglutathione lyase family enzyme